MCARGGGGGGGGNNFRHRSLRVPERSDPSDSVSRPLERNSTVVRASTDVFARYVGVDRVSIEPRGGGSRRGDFRRGYRAAFLHVLFRVTHPLLDGHFPTLPHELADRDHAGDPHAAHQHHEDAADVRQAELVRRRAALRGVVLAVRETSISLWRINADGCR